MSLFSLNNLEDGIVDIWLCMTQTLLRLSDNKTNIIYLASPLYVNLLVEFRTLYCRYLVMDVSKSANIK